MQCYYLHTVSHNIKAIQTLIAILQLATDCSQPILDIAFWLVPGLLLTVSLWTILELDGLLIYFEVGIHKSCNCSMSSGASLDTLTKCLKVYADEPLPAPLAAAVPNTAIVQPLAYGL